MVRGFLTDVRRRARVRRAQFEASMAAKLTDPAFLTDVPPFPRTKRLTS